MSKIFEAIVSERWMQHVPDAFWRTAENYLVTLAFGDSHGDHEWIR